MGLEIALASVNFVNSTNGSNGPPNPGVVVGAVVLLLFGLLVWVTAVALSVTCNIRNGAGAILPVLGAFFFPSIYLLQFSARQGLLREPGYCGRINGSA